MGNEDKNLRYSCKRKKTFYANVFMKISTISSSTMIINKAIISSIIVNMSYAKLKQS